MPGWWLSGKTEDGWWPYGDRMFSDRASAEAYYGGKFPDYTSDEGMLIDIRSYRIGYAVCGSPIRDSGGLFATEEAACAEVRRIHALIDPPLRPSERDPYIRYTPLYKGRQVFTDARYPGVKRVTL